MKANQFSNKEEAQVGIGTMIVFIATILVAAVAAGVLIDTSQKLQAKSTQTGVEATEEVGTSLEILHIFGERDQLDEDNTADATEGIDLLKLQVRLAPGASSIDLAKMSIIYDDGTSVGYNEMFYAAAQDVNMVNEFTLSNIDGTALGSTVITSGQLVQIQIGNYDVLNAADPDKDNQLGLGVKTDLSLTLLPPMGTEVAKSLTTPNTYANDKVFELY